MRQLRSSLVMLALPLLLAACPPPPAAGPEHPVHGVNPDGTPKWVHKGSGAYDGPQGKAFYGVGIVQGIDNESLSRQTADNRARGEIAKLFDTYIAALMKDYQRSTTAGDFKASAEEQDVVSAQKTITEVTLRGVEVRDHWTDPQNGALYALAILDLNTIERNAAGAQLPARIRDHVRANARRAFEDLDRELQKRGEAPESPPPEPAAPQAEAEPPPPPPPPQPSAPPAAKKGKPKVGLRISGMNRATIQTCFAGKLIDAGFDVYESTSDVDFMIRGQLKYKRGGMVNGAYMVKAWINVRVNSMRDARTRVAVAERVKVGRTDLNQSIQLAVSRLCDRIVPQIVAKIRSAL